MTKAAEATAAYMY